MSSISHKLVVTRKPHRCCFCEDTIAPKSKAYRCVYRDGGICVSYAHEECQRATEHAGWQESDYEVSGDGQEFKETTLAHYRASAAARKGGAS